MLLINGSKKQLNKIAKDVKEIKLGVKALLKEDPSAGTNNTVNTVSKKSPGTTIYRSFQDLIS